VSAVGTSVHVSRELREICGAKNIVDDPALLHTKTISGVTPAVAVTPASPEEVAAVLRLANERGLSVVPAGGFTRQQAGNVPGGIDVLLDTSALRGVEHYDAADLTIGLGAGWSVAQLSDKVAQDGLLFAGDAALPHRATVGGLLATGLAGPLRHGYGGLRDYCIGIRFVTGDGRKGKGGGRVVKNVAGFDLMKLLIGSWGTLAVITGASFKLFPAPRQTKTFVARFADAAEAIGFRDHVLRSPLSPISLELVSPSALESNDTAWCVYLRAAGSDAVLARYRTELGAAISTEIEGPAESAVWRRVADFACDAQPQDTVISLSLPLKEVLPALNQIAAMCESSGMTFAAIGRIGVGHLLISLLPRAGASPNFTPALSGFRNQLSRDASLSILSGGHADLWRSPTHSESMGAVKHALDPKGILNPGRFRF
jgi:glycolate oxidase FAD binding subunit